MKRHWRRVMLRLAAVLLALIVVGLSIAVRLHTSGRLATLAQHLLHRLSGQELRFETIAFPAWNTVAFTNVRL
jgi:hypothetical protein